MLKTKKGVELPITAIIVFVILLIVAVVMIVIFVGKTKSGSEAIGSCALKQGQCSDTVNFNDPMKCPSGWVSLGDTADCSKGGTQYKCCLTIA